MDNHINNFSKRSDKVFDNLYATMPEKWQSEHSNYRNNIGNKTTGINSAKAVFRNSYDFTNKT